MTITALHERQWRQWPLFLQMIDQEGWRISAAEQKLYRRAATHPFLCLQQGDKTLGFISAVRHGQEAWIGNLIVSAAERGKGYGARLFDAMMEHLHQCGCTTIWLTASEDGRPLYEKRGFIAIDHIQRWKTTGLGQEWGTRHHLRYLSHCDYSQHRQQRSDFLRTIADNGHVVRYENNVALLQPGSNMTLLGPWYEQGCDRQAHYHFLLKGRRVCARKHQLVSDIYASTQLQQPLTAAGFKHCGTTTLMHYGSNNSCQQFSPGLQRSLAGLGSFN